MIEILKTTFVYRIVNPIFQIYLYLVWEFRKEKEFTPHLVKQALIKRLCDEYKIGIFVETGTYLGNMVDSVKSRFEKIFSIELDERLFRFSQKRFERYKHIQIIHGDSSREIKKVLKKIKKPALFWLDAHYSGGLTGGKDYESPIISELKSILSHKVRGHVILIDDAHLFGCNSAFPRLGKIKELVNKSLYEFKIENGMIEILPRPRIKKSRLRSLKSRIYFFIGTTAELIKIAPVIRELEKRKENFEVISSNQNVLHFEDLSFIIKKKEADYTFRMKKYKWINNIYVGFVIWILRSVFNFYLFFRKKAKQSVNVLLVVQGDTITALVGALVAKLCGIKLAHIESGLRSFNFLEPFPEELSRFIISKLSDLHFCPNNWSVKNLTGSNGIKINTNYNTLVESTFGALGAGKETNFKKSLKNKKYFILVLHRQEHMLFHSNFTEKLIDIFLKYAEDSNIVCVFIMHSVTLDFLRRRGKYFNLVSNSHVILSPRMKYPEFVDLLSGCEFIATDGGSNQEEAYYLGKPCLILRKYTERIEGLGKNAVLSKDSEKIIADFLSNYKSYRKKPLQNFKSPSKIIADYLLDFKNG